MRARRSAEIACRRAFQVRSWGAVALLLVLCSCRHRTDPLHYIGPEHRADYLNRATQVSYVDQNAPPSAEIDFALPPRTVRHRERDQIWELGLPECIHLALSNSEIIRNAGQFLSPQNPLLASPDFVASVYDPAIQESGVLFGQRGVEAALADFDTQFTSRALWGRSEQVQNNTISLGLPAGDVLVDETAAVSSSLQKSLATGGILSLSHNWNYTGRNIGVPPQLFPSVYEGNVQFQFRQPLLAGAGVEYTRIAGPVSDNIQGVTGVQQGVIIARINSDMVLADFERDVHHLIHDVERLYWQLHLAYRTYGVLVESRNASLDGWRLIDAQRQAQTGSGGALEADLRDIFLENQNRADQARDAIYDAEAQLRLLLGLPVNDGRIIRPSDSPMSAEFLPDWAMSLADAFSGRPEIRRQKWNIRSLDLQLRAAKNQTMPRLDFVSGYQVNGFGDDLFDQGNGTPDGRYASAYEDLMSRDQTSWNLGMEFSVPIGRRYAFAQVRSLELKLAKAQAILQEQEVEISHEIAASFREIDKSYQTLENAYNRWLVGKERLQLIQAQYQAEPTRYLVDSVLRAQQGVAQAELTFASSLVEYNSAIAGLNLRTGKTLATNNVSIMEGSWTRDARLDARRRYQERKHAVRTELLHSEPEVFR